MMIACKLIFWSIQYLSLIIFSEINSLLSLFCIMIYR